ncbi:MAG: type IV pilus biogenesis protein PilP [Alphaproteobacteria bacterium]|nr:type IV pilus biogenesis protein PilP [Alphaproteobacteria bacterium]
MRIANERRLPVPAAAWLLALVALPLAGAAPARAEATVASHLVTTGGLTQTEGSKIAAQAAAIGKSVAKAEDTAVENANAVVDKLDHEQGAATLEDLNNARQAIARLDAMIQIEKHLAELKKIRHLHTDDNALANAIPASALAPPAPVLAPPVESAPQPVIRRPVVRRPSYETPQVTRIVGSDGKYVAMLKAGGDTKVATVGEDIPGVGLVQSISSSTVVIERDGKTHVVRIKGVDAIYSAMR